jgi:hypothetical protein
MQRDEEVPFGVVFKCHFFINKCLKAGYSHFDKWKKALFMGFSGSQNAALSTTSVIFQQKPHFSASTLAFRKVPPILLRRIKAFKFNP